MAKVMAEVKQVDLKTSVKCIVSQKLRYYVGYILRISRHISKVTNGT